MSRQKLTFGMATNIGTEKSGLGNVISVVSNGDYTDPALNHVNLNAVTSQISISAVGGDLSTEQKYIILRRLNYEGLRTLEDLPVGATFMIEKIQNLSVDEAVEILKEALIEHDEDPNFPADVYQLIERLLESGNSSNPTSLFNKDGETIEHVQEKVDYTSSNEEADNVDLVEIFDWSFQVRMEAALIAFYSPYPEVRSVTDCFDDPSMYCETPRVYILGLIWSAIGTFINQFFANRQPGITLPSSVVQLLLYPSGLLLAAVLPKWKFTIRNTTFDLNPGPWNHKEQMLATIFYSVSGGTYVNSNIPVQKMEMFYDNKWADFGYQTLLILSTNFLGFGFAGIMRKFCIYPVRSVWPEILPTLALNSALLKPEKKENINGWLISRYWFFLYAFVGMFLYFWIPNYLMAFILTFNWMSWIAPTNVTLAEITGSVGGLGFNPITSFDWNVIDSNGCLTYPFFSQITQYIGSIIGFFCIVGVYYSNYYWTGYIPINSNKLFTNTGERYDVKSIVNEKSLFDQEKYDLVGPPFYSAANLVLYGAFFAIYPFSIIYECTIHRKAMWKSIKSLTSSMKSFTKSTFDGFNDPHSRMMSQYPEVPEWCFLVVLVISIVLAILCVELYPAQTPVWGIFFTIGINFVFLIPLTAIRSTTGFSFGLNVLVELIVGYALPGNGLALNLLKAFGYNIDGQAQNYISDQKMGHYAKLPPRAMFRCQILAVFESSFIALGVINFLMTNIEDYCTPLQKQKMTCPGLNTFYSASVIWGVIGPKKVFGGLYPILQWCFLIGALLPIPCILFKWYGPKSVTRVFQPTLIIGGILIYAPYNLSYYTMGIYVGSIFMFYLRRHYLTWWEKYNYVLASALSAGVAFSGIIIFFAVQYHDKSISWWGNNVVYAGADAMVASIGRLNATISAPDGYFGPRIGSFP